MSELEYSVEARNVLDKFFAVDTLVYVEGDDDIVFWELLFDHFSEIDVKVEDAGGKKQLEARLAEISSGAGDFLIAMDSDYDLLQEHSDHPQVLRTFGYSMENTVVSEVTLQRLVRHIAKVPSLSFPLMSAQEWLSDLESATEPLILADIVNRTEGIGQTVISKNCDRFLTSRRSSSICPRKVESHLQELSIPAKPDVEDKY